MRAYRLSSLRRRYPDYVWQLEAGGRCVQVMNPLHPAWWREWASPLWAGARRYQARWLLGLVRIV